LGHILLVYGSKAGAGTLARIIHDAGQARVPFAHSHTQRPKICASIPILKG